MAVRTEFATVEVPIVLRDRLAAMRIHPRQALHELIEESLDLWDDVTSGKAGRRAPPLHVGQSLM